jgi:hypothetical protein
MFLKNNQKNTRIINTKGRSSTKGVHIDCSSSHVQYSEMIFNHYDCTSGLNENYI